MVNVPRPKRYTIVNLGILQKFIDEKKINVKDAVDENMLQESGLIKRKRDGVRILAKGNISSKVDLIVSGASKSAITAVEQAGGSIKLL